jgi:hypothetical protein
VKAQATVEVAAAPPTALDTASVPPFALDAMLDPPIAFEPLDLEPLLAPPTAPEAVLLALALEAALEPPLLDVEVEVFATLPPVPSLPLAGPELPGSFEEHPVQTRSRQAPHNVLSTLVIFSLFLSPGDCSTGAHASF